MKHCVETGNKELTNGAVKFHRGTKERRSHAPHKHAAPAHCVQYASMEHGLERQRDPCKGKQSLPGHEG